jgi:hypothetical protein
MAIRLPAMQLEHRGPRRIAMPPIFRRGAAPQNFFFLDPPIAHLVQ